MSGLQLYTKSDNGILSLYNNVPGYKIIQFDRLALCVNCINIFYKVSQIWSTLTNMDMH